jgi:hypothetical protein
MNSEWSLTITVEVVEFFLDGMAKAFTIRKCVGRSACVEMSPHCLAASRTGMRISLYTASNIWAGVEEVETGRPRMRREEDQEAWSSLFT